MKKTLLVVDCQYDFINGSLACENSQRALDSIIDYINNNDLNVYYSLDWHSEKNKSFNINGGTWPIHCVENTKGSRIHDKFYIDINEKKKSPLKEDNLFFKGKNDDYEEYSAFNAINNNNKRITDVLNDEVIVCGIASEYCIKETVLELYKNGYKVKILEQGLAYVNEKDHRENIKNLRDIGIEFI